MEQGRERRRSRGSASVEWIVVAGIIAIPFGLAVLAVARDLVPYYTFLERMNALPLP